ncbi:IclR family transcriptional regulator [Thalassobacillus sp. CUG 92003]|uniref:IclR family transcriptional regulator n=1 Tax=Thalassobacillus sp. CUG 92003 TaxID=2736641 RepID=UPI0015E7674B|nr:IclR family transcriptional regulator [Thalassobacillus sp. CUG 92003]
MTNEKGKRVQSLESGFAILKMIAKYQDPITLQALANETGLYKSQLYRYLNSFVHMGVLTRTSEDTPRWSLGPELISLGSAAFDGIDIAREAAPELIKLRNQVNETVALSIWREDGPFFVRVESSNKLMNVGLKTGSYVPLYTATGNIFRAFLPKDKTQDLYEEEVDKQNINSVSYDKDIERVRNNMFSVSRSRFIPGVVAISTPIFYSGKKLAGAISIVGVSAEERIDIESNVVKSLFSSAQQVSEKLGYTENINNRIGL